MYITDGINLDTTGKLGDRVYYVSQGEKKSRSYFIPVQPGTPAQLAWWQVFRNGVVQWHALSPAQEKVWNVRAKRWKMSGFNYFMSKYLKARA